MKSEEPIVIDIIILSYAKNDKLKKLTEQTIETCLKSENPTEINFNIIVIESNKSLKPFQFKSTKTIYPDTDFGFNKYLNIGIKNSTNDYLCLCNNDLIFHKNWASEIIKAMKIDKQLLSASTFCPKFHDTYLSRYNEKINYGYQNGLYFTGWCFLLKRSVFKITGIFDEKFKFWFSDDDFRLTLQKHNVPNALIKSAKVTHLASGTLNSSNNKKQMNLKYCSFAYYKYKWLHHNFLKYVIETMKYKLKIFLAK